MEKILINLIECYQSNQKYVFFSIILLTFYTLWRLSAYSDKINTAFLKLVDKIIVLSVFFVLCLFFIFPKNDPSLSTQKSPLPSPIDSFPQKKEIKYSINFIPEDYGIKNIKSLKISGAMQKMSGGGYWYLQLKKSDEVLIETEFGQKIIMKLDNNNKLIQI